MPRDRHTLQPDPLSPPSGSTVAVEDRQSQFLDLYHPSASQACPGIVRRGRMCPLYRATRPFGVRSPQRISANETMPVGADEYARTLIMFSWTALPCATPAAIGIVSFPAPQKAPST